MKTFVIICGLNDKDTRKQEITTDNAKRRLADIVLAFADGATLTECDGIYKHHDGGIVFEKSIKIEIAGISKKAALTIARQAKAAPFAYKHYREALQQAEAVLRKDSFCDKTVSSLYCLISEAY